MGNNRRKTRLFWIDSQLHFAKRAGSYNYSAGWVRDHILIEEIYQLAELTPDAYVLDIGIGTGKIAEAFHKKVKYVAGVDISMDMARCATRHVDAVVLSPAERMPFKDKVFDICICRQGLQFMEIDKVLKETYRVSKPCGVLILCHLTAYGQEDKDTTFLIQRLRNPARKNFFLPTDFYGILKRNNFRDIEFFEYITRESVNRWINNGTINKRQQERIKRIYQEAPEDFKRIHNIQFKNDQISDSMKMLIVRAKKL